MQLSRNVDLTTFSYVCIQGRGLRGGQGGWSPQFCWWGGTEAPLSPQYFVQYFTRLRLKCPWNAFKSHLQQCRISKIFPGEAEGWEGGLGLRRCFIELPYKFLYTLTTGLCKYPVTVSIINTLWRRYIMADENPSLCSVSVQLLP